MAAPRKKTKRQTLLDEVAAQLDIVVTHARDIIGYARPMDPRMNCDIAMHDLMVAWQEHRSISTASGLAYRAWEYFGGLKLFIKPTHVFDDPDEDADRIAREAAAKALELLGHKP